MQHTSERTGAGEPAPTDLPSSLGGWMLMVAAFSAMGSVLHAQRHARDEGMDG